MQQNISWTGTIPGNRIFLDPTLTTPLREFVFYGASRFEAPKVGLKFRRSGTTFQVLGIRTERTRSREFARSWKFTAECQAVPLWGN